jgi:protein phosphatase
LEQAVADPPGSGREAAVSKPLFDIAALSDVGTEREHNEDRCGTSSAGPACALVAVADGVSSSVAGEEASQTAIDVTLRVFGEQGSEVPAAKRLVLAVQQANIEVYDRALVVPELRGMATTLTAAVLDGGDLSIAHVGDSRLYLIRGEKIVQLTKDHTVVGERTRMGLLSEKRARKHPDRSTLTRSLGRELIVAVDRIRTSVETGDVVIVCSDGLYNVLEDEELREIASGRDAAGVCHALVDAANERGTLDNLTAAVVRVEGPLPVRPQPPGLMDLLKRALGKSE